MRCYYIDSNQSLNIFISHSEDYQTYLFLKVEIVTFRTYYISKLKLRLLDKENSLISLNDKIMDLVVKLSVFFFLFHLTVEF